MAEIAFDRLSCVILQKYSIMFVTSNVPKGQIIEDKMTILDKPCNGLSYEPDRVVDANLKSNLARQYCH